ncbi:Holliday junction DNA helicase RuvB [Mycobacteroides abscessus subsp. massiliense]|nr:Holliday junction DNA helicase RuvB [Mycobacteroides abscessus subsp. massiliense]
MSRFDEFDGPEDDFDAGPEMSGALTVGENDIDAGLRPKSLREFIGQPRVREQLDLVLSGAKNRGGTGDLGPGAGAGG